MFDEMGRKSHLNLKQAMWKQSLQNEGVISKAAVYLNLQVLRDFASIKTFRVLFPLLVSLWYELS